MERPGTPEAVREAVGRVRRDGGTIALVPTMGALHEGHLSLVRAARARTDAVFVSVFVNPAQFGPGEDLAAYPRDLECDAELLATEGAFALFAPGVESMYPVGSSTTVDPGVLGTVLEGASRPGHFVGVATVVIKLLSMVAPDVAFFGEKDFQQLVIIDHIVRDLDLPVRVVGCPTVREPDGLAMSSRNAYLDGPARDAATVLHRGLRAVADLAASGERSGAALATVLAATVAAEPLAALDYAAVVDPGSLAPIETLECPARALVAARVGPARLIDNIEVLPGRPS